MNNKYADQMRNDIANISQNKNDEGYIVIRDKDENVTIKNYPFIDKFLKDVRKYFSKDKNFIKFYHEELTWFMNNLINNKEKKTCVFYIREIKPFNVDFKVSAYGLTFYGDEGRSYNLEML